MVLTTDRKLNLNLHEKRINEITFYSLYYNRTKANGLQLTSYKANILVNVINTDLII